MQHAISSDGISFHLSPSFPSVEIIKLRHAEFHITAFDWNCNPYWLQVPPHQLVTIHLGIILFQYPLYIPLKLLLKHNFFYFSPVT